MNIERMQLMLTMLKEIRDQPKSDVVFNLTVWASPLSEVGDFTIAASDGRIFPEGFCGTVACAVGHACLDPRFNSLGLHLDTDRRQPLPAYEGAEDWDAVEQFFDIDDETAEHLFYRTTYPDDEDTNISQVIKRVEKAIEEELFNEHT